MEQVNQPGGDPDAISNGRQYEPSEPTPHPDVPIRHDSTRNQPLPLTFAEAEQHNAFTLLEELHEHAMAPR